MSYIFVRRLFAGSAVVTAFGVLAACNSTTPAAAATVASDSVVTLGPTDVAIATRVPLASGVTITGSLDPVERVEIKAQLSGQLDRVVVDRGHAVTRGQVLVTYQSAAIRSRAASAEAALASRERDLDAADTLYNAGVFSERDHILARVARDAAQADVAQSREALGFATVRAPFSGEISERIANSGEVVQPGNKLLVLVNTDALELAGQIDAAQIGAVRVGQAVQLTLEAYAGRALSGRVVRVEPVASSDTRRIGVYVRVPNAKHEIVAGLFARGTILSGVDGPSPLLAVPAAAVTVTGNTASLHVVAGDRIEKREVQLGAHDEGAGLVEIRSGLADGESVVIAPGATLSHGTRVKRTNPRTATR